MRKERTGPARNHPRHDYATAEASSISASHRKPMGVLQFHPKTTESIPFLEIHLVLTYSSGIRQKFRPTRPGSPDILATAHQHTREFRQFSARYLVPQAADILIFTSAIMQRPEFRRRRRNSGLTLLHSHLNTWCYRALRNWRCDVCPKRQKACHHRERSTRKAEALNMSHATHQQWPDESSVQDPTDLAILSC